MQTVIAINEKAYPKMGEGMLGKCNDFPNKQLKSKENRNL